MTIKGTGRPGFFIIFGLLFGAPAVLIGPMILFGTVSSDGEPFPKIFAGLFLLPFFLIGASTFLTGLFLWFGKTQIEFGRMVVSVQRSLFGKVFQQKSLARADLNLSFEKSHENNDVPQYKLSFQEKGTKKKIGVGGSLKEPELLWLEREARLALGEEEIEEHRSVFEAMMRGGVEEIGETVVDPNYRSKYLRFTRTNNGWEAQSRPSMGGAIGLMLMGSIFVIVGLMMITESREFLLDLVPSIRDFFANATSSGENPPRLFALAFGGMGLLVVLIGFFLLGYRVQISKRHSRLHIQRRWIVIAISSAHDLSEFTGLEMKQNGHVNDVSRYRLDGLLRGGKKKMLLGYAPAEDVGQLHARLKEVMLNVSE